jgi:cell wall-associated NlpC family hydrolase
MKRVLFSLLLTMGLAHANPSNPAADDLESLLAQRGLVAQFTQIGKSVTNQASDLVVNAMGYLGVPYKRGGNGAAGFDCSGFVRAMYENTLGLVLPHNAKAQAAVTEKIDRSELQPGDLVFYNTLRKTFSHVGIYIGNGKFIHSPRTGGEVRIENMSDTYWVKRFNGARRVTPDTSVSSTEAASR